MESISNQNVQSWLYSALKNVSCNFYRAAQKCVCEDIDDPLFLEDETLSYNETFEVSILLSDAISSLSDPVDIKLFEFVAIYGFSYCDTAAALSLTPRQVKYRYPTIRRRVLTYFINKGINKTGELL